MVDLRKAILLAVKTGKVTFGFKGCVEALRGGKAKLLVVAKNSSLSRKKELELLAKLSNTPILQYEGSSLDLGNICGKPFTISAMAVRDAGDSDIIKLVG